MNIRQFVREHLLLPTQPARDGHLFCDIVVEDVSPSMDEIGFEKGKSKRDLMDAATLRFVSLKQAQRPQDCVAIVTYGDTASLACPLVNVIEGREQLLAGMESARHSRTSGTCINAGLGIALDLLAHVPGSSPLWGLPIIKRVLAYSDGWDACEREALGSATRIKALGAVVETFGIAKSPKHVDEAFLRNVATVDADGFVHYQFLASGEEIGKTFTQLATGMLTFEG